MIVGKGAKFIMEELWRNCKGGEGSLYAGILSEGPSYRLHDLGSLLFGIKQGTLMSESYRFSSSVFPDEES